MHQRGRAGGEELCCWEGAALKMRSCWHGFYTEQLLHRGALHRGTLHGGAFTQRSLYTGRTLHRESFTQRNFYTGKVLHRSFYTEKSLYIVVLCSLDTEKLANTHREATEKLLHAEALTQRSLYTEELLHREACTHRGAFPHRRFNTKKLLHRAAFTHRHVYTQRGFTHVSF